MLYAPGVNLNRFEPVCTPTKSFSFTELQRLPGAIQATIATLSPSAYKTASLTVHRNAE
jgi:hypothetical protein